MYPTDSLFQAILDRPTADKPRLAYADWLTGRGDPRGEFIRLQCLLPHIPRQNPRRRDLEKRERRLLKNHLTHWRDELPAIQGVQWGEHYVRGFIEEAFLSAELFLREAETIFRTLPIRHLRLWGIQDVSRLAACPYLARLTSLDLGVFLGNAGANGHADPWTKTVQALAQSPHLVYLRGLGLHDSAFGNSGAEAVARHLYLPHLGALHLDLNQITDAGTLALAVSPHLGRLAHLCLNGNAVEAAGVRALVDAPGLVHLRKLSLDRNLIGPEGAAALAGCRRLLRRRIALHLGGNQIGDEGARALAACAHLQRLRILDLHRNDIGDDGVRALAASPYLAGLRTLDLSYNRIQDAGAQALAAYPNLVNLADLLLRGNQIQDGGARALAASSCLNAIGWLSLGSNPISEEADLVLESRFGDAYRL